MWDLLKSGGGGMVFQINEGDSGGDIALYASGDVSMKIEFLKMELKHCKEMLKHCKEMLKHCKEMLEQKDKEIELLRKLTETV